jgi:hypothetical protein
MDDDGDTLTYAVGGDDMASFAIDSATAWQSVTRLRPWMWTRTTR